MTAQVIFLNRLYWPDKEEQDRLEELQERLELYHAELAFKAKDLNEFQKWVQKEASHHQTRASWKLIKGE